MAQGQQPGSCKSNPDQRERSESDRKAEESSTYTIYGRWWPRDNGLCFVSTAICDTVDKLPCRGWRGCGECPCGVIHAVVPPYPHISLPVVAALMSFTVSDLCPHNIGWHSPHLQKRKRERPSPIQKAAATLGAVSSGAFGMHQRITLARVPQLLPQQLPVAGSL